MVSENGVIEKTLEKKAVVRIQKSPSCATCNSRGSCGVMSGKDMVIEVANELQAKAGDRVEISVPTGTMIKLSLLIHLFPIMALLIGAISGRACAAYIHVQPTVASIIGGGLAVGLSFYLLKRLNRSAITAAKYRPRMTRIL
ncbi:MAG: SoxR reducing system RseC family protein [Thermodesulfobacteriota bacterium]|nr:SoxR reducing system RseC family protein [Thermodesulfobacteriota bacterium]